MVRTKNVSRILSCGLIALSLFSQSSWAQDFKIGELTQVEGQVTYFHFTPPHVVLPVKTKETLKTDGSYLTQDSSFMTVKLFEGNYLRLNPKSKISLEYDAKGATVTVHLFTGSLKVFFKQQENVPQAQKLMVKSADTIFETVNGKFSVVRSSLEDSNSVYVEKGSVMAAQFVKGEKRDSEIVHGQEMTSVKDNESDIASPTVMTDKQIKFLHPSQYLGKQQSEI